MFSRKIFHLSVLAVLFLSLVWMAGSQSFPDILSPAPAEIAAPIHCRGDCYDETIYYAGDTLDECIMTIGDMCAGYTGCGKQGEDCPACCPTYCSDADLPSLIAIRECRDSCRMVCDQNANVYSLRIFAQTVTIVIAAIIFSLCGIKFILSSDPYSRNQSKKCVIVVFAALVILGISSSMVDLFYREPVEGPVIRPYVDILRANVVITTTPGDDEDTQYYTTRLNMMFRDGWMPVTDLNLVITSPKHSIGSATFSSPDCNPRDEQGYGNMDPGDTREYTQELICSTIFVVNFTADEGTWDYELYCGHESGRCYVTKIGGRILASMDLSPSPPPPPVPGCEASGGCDGYCAPGCTVYDDPDCGCSSGDPENCCGFSDFEGGIQCTYEQDNDCPVPECLTSDECNANCVPGCTVDEDPDCGCRHDDGCCGFSNPSMGTPCTFDEDNDCDTGGVCEESFVSEGDVVLEWIE